MLTTSGNWDKVVQKGGVELLVKFISSHIHTAEMMAARELSARSEDIQFANAILHYGYNLSTAI